MNDDWCQPGGTCGPTGQCMNLVCVDAGVVADAGGPGIDGGLADTGDAGDAGDAGAIDVGDVGDVGDAGDVGTSTTPDGSVSTDSGVTTPIVDAGPIDTGPRLSSTPEIRDETYDQGCECTATTVGGPAPWTGFALLGGLLLRRRRRTTAS